MIGKLPTLLAILLKVVKFVWMIAVIIGATSAGALIGWHNHGIVGAMALGFVGFCAGIALSYPSMLLQLLS